MQKQGFQQSIFNYQIENSFSQLRTFEIEGNIWFVANDVAIILGYKKPSDAVARHCKSKGTMIQSIPTNSGIQKMRLINEPNLYRLVLKSQLETAENFEDWILEEVLPSIRKKGYYGKIDRSALPNFYLRYQNNVHKIDRNYFSVISELFVTLNAEFEKVGYQIPDRGIDDKAMYPDISVGRTFSNWLKNHRQTSNFNIKTYMHSFPDNRADVEAKMYPIDLLPDFRRFIYEVWIPLNAEKYFKKKDPKALDFIPLLIGSEKDNFNSNPSLEKLKAVLAI